MACCWRVGIGSPFREKAAHAASRRRISSPARLFLSFWLLGVLGGREYVGLGDDGLGDAANGGIEVGAIAARGEDADAFGLRGGHGVIPAEFVSVRLAPCEC